MTTTALTHWQMALDKAELRVANVLKRGQSAAMSRLNKSKAAYKRALTGSPPRIRHHDTIPMEVAGIPCSFWLTHYDPGYPAKLHGHPDDMHPGADPEIEYVLCDRDGYEAGEWLYGKIDRAELDAEVLRIVIRVE